MSPKVRLYSSMTFLHFKGIDWPERKSNLQKNCESNIMFLLLIFYSLSNKIFFFKDLNSSSKCVRSSNAKQDFI